MKQRKRHLIQRLQKELPKLRINKTELFEHGWDHDILLVNNQDIFRFVKNKRYLQTLEREVNFLRAFRRLSNVAVPQYFFLSKNKNFGGYPMIPGVPLNDFFSKNLHHHRSDLQKSRLARTLGTFLTILHAYPLKRAAALGFKWGWRVKDWKKHDRKANRVIFPGLTRGEVSFIQTFQKNFYETRERSVPVLLHADLQGEHIFINPKTKKISGIIDFGDARLGDPAIDFFGLAEIDPRFAELVYRFYRGPKDPGLLRRARFHLVEHLISLLYDGIKLRKPKVYRYGYRGLRFWMRRREELFK